MQIPTPNLADPRFKANPHPFYARLRAEAPVYCARVPGWVVDQLAWEVLRDDRALPVGEEPARLWALGHGAFTQRLVEQLRTRIEALCDRLLDVARRGHTLDLVAA